MVHFTKFVGQTIAMALAFALLIAQLADAHPFKNREATRIDRFEQEEDAFAAPALSGPEQVYDSTRFRIHYTLLGQDAVPKADDNANGTPDYVEQVVVVLEEVYRIEVEQFGWVAPPADKGFGGNDLYDVCLLDWTFDKIGGTAP